MGSATPGRGEARGEAEAKGRCPICTAPTEKAFRPFCSRRCADVDLSRWLRGAYAVPGRADVDEDGEDTIAASGPQRQADDDDPGAGGRSRLAGSG